MKRKQIIITSCYSYKLKYYANRYCQHIKNIKFWTSSKYAQFKNSFFYELCIKTFESQLNLTSFNPVASLSVMQFQIQRIAPRQPIQHRDRRKQPKKHNSKNNPFKNLVKPLQSTPPCNIQGQNNNFTTFSDGNIAHIVDDRRAKSVGTGTYKTPSKVN